MKKKAFDIKSPLRGHWGKVLVGTGLAFFLGAISALVFSLVGPTLQLLSSNSPTEKLALSSLLGSKLANFASRLLDKESFSAEELWQYLPSCLILLAALRASLSASLWALWEWLSEELSAELRLKLVEAYICSDPMAHSDQSSTAQSNLVAAITQDARLFREYIVHYYGGLPRELIKVGFFSATLWALSPRLVLVFCVGIAPLALILSRLSKRLRRRSASALVDFARLGEWIQQRLLGIETIKHCQTEYSEGTRLAKFNQEMRGRFYKMARTKTLIPTVSEFIAVISMALIFYLFLDGRFIGEISGAVQLSFFSTLAVLAQSASQLGKYLSQNRESAAAIDRLIILSDELRKSRVEKPNGWQTHVETQGQNQVILDSISIQYVDSQSPVLEALSFKFVSGKIYCLIGSSGAGKTTVLRTILGLVRPQSGSLTRLSKNINIAPGYLPQHCPLFPGNIAENLSYPLVSGESQKLRRSLDDCGLGELGLGEENYMTGGRLALSGGQIQRLFLARILYQEPELVLVDEGTSALDPSLESMVLTQLRKLCAKGSTVIMSAHRLSTILGADMLLFLENGKLRAVGPPSELNALPEISAFLAKLGPL